MKPCLIHKLQNRTPKTGTNVSVVIKSSSVNVDLPKSTTLNLTSNSQKM